MNKMRFMLLFAAILSAIVYSYSATQSLSTIFMNKPEWVDEVVDPDKNVIVQLNNEQCARNAAGQPTAFPKYKSTRVEGVEGKEQVTFFGLFKPTTGNSKLGIYSDDGCEVTIKNVTKNADVSKDQNYRAGQALGSPASFRKLSFPSPLTTDIYSIEVKYSNTCYLGDTDIDGCTLVAYEGGGILPIFPSVEINIDNKDSALIQRNDEKLININLQSNGTTLNTVTQGLLQLSLLGHSDTAELRENNTTITSGIKTWDAGSGNSVAISAITIKGLKQSSVINDIQLELAYIIGGVVIDSKSVFVTVNTIPTALSFTVDKVQYSNTDIHDIFPGYNNVGIVLSGLDTGETPIGDLSYRITKMPDHGFPLKGINDNGSVNHFHDKDINNNILSPSVPVVSYDSQYGWYGTDTLKYVVNDGISDSLEATVSIIIKASIARHFPVSDNKTVSFIEDSVNNNITLSGIDSSNHPLKYQIIEGPFHGSLDKRGPDTGNVFKYTPNSKWNGNDYLKYIVKEDITNGVDSITARVNINVDHVNHSPTADNQTFSINKAFPLEIILATDPDDDLLNIEYTATPLHGTITTNNLQRPEFIIYTPDTNDNAIQDIIKFKATDIPGDNLIPVTTSEKTITINLTTGNILPIAYDITESTFAGKILTFTLPVENIDEDILTFAVDGNSPIHGAITFDNDKKLATYTPNILEINVNDTFKYKVTDEHGSSSSANISVNVDSNPPVVSSRVIDINDITLSTDIIFSADDTDQCDTIFEYEYTQPNRGSLSKNNGIVKYAPDTDFSGLTTFQYRAKDEHGTYSEYATIVLNIVLPATENNAPVADNIYLEISKSEGSRTITLKGSDADDDLIEYEIINSISPNYGVFGNITDDKIIYTPDFAHLGEYTFTYRVKEIYSSKKESNPATVTINVIDLSASIVLLGINSLSSDVIYNNVSGKVYPALYIDLKPNEKINDSTSNISIQIDETEKNDNNELWHSTGESRYNIPFNLILNNWEWYNTAASTWVKCDDTNMPTQYNLTGNIRKYRYYINNDNGLWNTLSQPLGHNGSHTIMLSQEINITKNEGYNLLTNYTISVRPVDVTVNNTTITDVSTSNGNSKNDYVKYDPNGWDYYKKPNFKFKINNDGKSHNYIIDVFLRATGILSWSYEQPYITKDITINNNTCTEIVLGDDEEINNCSNLIKGTYTFDIYIREVDDLSSRNEIDSEEYKTQYCLSIQDHSVWVDTDANGIQTLKASYSLNDQGGHSAKEINLVVLDENLNEISVINGQTAINLTHAGDGSGIICHTGGNYNNWRILFTGNDSDEDDFRNRIHQAPRMLAVNLLQNKILRDWIAGNRALYDYELRKVLVSLIIYYDIMNDKEWSSVSSTLYDPFPFKDTEENRYEYVKLGLDKWIVKQAVQNAYLALKTDYSKRKCISRFFDGRDSFEATIIPGHASTHFENFDSNKWIIVFQQIPKQDANSRGLIGLELDAPNFVQLLIHELIHAQYGSQVNYRYICGDRNIFGLKWINGNDKTTKGIPFDTQDIGAIYITTKEIYEKLSYKISERLKVEVNNKHLKDISLMLTNDKLNNDNETIKFINTWVENDNAIDSWVKYP